MKRALFLFAGIVFLAAFSAGILISRLSTEELVICAAQDDAFHIPKPACRFYFDHFLSEENAKQLEAHAGLAYAFEISNMADRYAIVDKLISLGVDVNGASKIDGLTPLNAAILLNDPPLVKLLLDRGADPSHKGRPNGFNATEYIQFLERKNDGIDRGAISAILRGASPH